VFGVISHTICQETRRKTDRNEEKEKENDRRNRETKKVLGCTGRGNIAAPELKKAKMKRREGK
jgi:hypothetical protein